MFSTGALEKVHVALCGMRGTDLETDTVKILGIHFPYNEKENKLENVENYRKHVIKNEKLLKVWRIRQLSIEMKTILAKAVHLGLVKEVPSSTITKLNKIQK